MAIESFIISATFCLLCTVYLLGPVFCLCAVLPSITRWQYKRAEKYLPPSHQHVSITTAFGGHLLMAAGWQLDTLVATIYSRLWGNFTRHSSVIQLLTDLLYSLEIKARGCICGHQQWLNSCFFFFFMDHVMKACKLTDPTESFSTLLSCLVCVCTLQHCGGVSVEQVSLLLLLLLLCACACARAMVRWSWLIADFCVYESDRGRQRPASST